MRTGPLADALIEHSVGDLGRYALENGFHAIVKGLSWHELSRGRAAGRSWVTGGAARPGHQGGRAARAGDHRGSATAMCPPLPVGQPDDRPGRPGAPCEG